MSFLLDPPALFIIGILLYFIGNKLGLERLAKITIGLLVVIVFISFSILLYADVFRCVFPVICNGLSSSEFMFHSDITGIYKKDVPLLIVIVLFALYPVFIYLGYASALMISKPRRYSNEFYSDKDVKSRNRPVKSKYSVIRYPDGGINDPRKATRLAVDRLGGIKEFVKQGDKVLVKINVCGGVPELIGTYTTKEVAEVVVDMVREVGGDPFLCDADMVWTKFWPTAKAEGWVEWAEKKKVKLINLSETKIVNFKFGKDKIMPVEKVSKEILDANVIISIPAMKTHTMTSVTLGMKNMYGTLPEIDKAKYHKKGINEVIYMINNAFTPNLTIIDGSIGGESGGPLSCDSVDYHTIIASNDVVTADSIASQMMGYKEPEKDIVHIRFAQEKGLGDAMQKFDFKTLPSKHASDGNWNRPDPEVAKFNVWSTNKFLNLPGWDNLFSIASDFFCYDMARLPVLKHITKALLEIMNELGKWFLLKNPDSTENKKRSNNNLIILSVLGLLSLFGFVYGGYLAKSSLYYSLAYLSSFIFAAIFATRMKTKHFVTISGASILVSFLVEYFTVRAGMWHYIDTSGLPIYPMFSTPLLMINIIGFSNFLRKTFDYVELNGSKLRMVPFIMMLLGFILFLQFENYVAVLSPEVIVVYLAFILLGLSHNLKQNLEWNLAVASVAIGCGFITEFLGASSGLWSYAYYEPLPIFLILGWTLNVWAVCGLAQVFKVDLSEAIVD
jgi:uncharacterized protein (DUF362 family)